MTPQTVGPLSRPLAVDRLPPEGAEVVVEATAEECAALAAEFKLPAIHSIEGRYAVTGSARGVHVVGQVRASLTQICVVTLDPFDSTMSEDVAVDFAHPDVLEKAAPVQGEADRPDEIVDGRIDLGRLTAEFVALGLDPYPKKPGTAFAYDQTPDDAAVSPFAALEKLKRAE